MRAYKKIFLLLLPLIFLAATPLPPHLAELPHAQLVAEIAPPTPPTHTLQTQQTTPAQRVIIHVNNPEDIPQLQEQLRELTTQEKTQLKETIREFSIHETNQQPRHRYNAANSFATQLTASQQEQLTNHPLIKEIRTDKPVKLHMKDTVELIQATDAWEVQVSGSNLTGTNQAVCVIDTGIDYTHPDFGGCSAVGGGCPKVPAGINYVDGEDENDPYDSDSGHGTHVAGTIAANGTLQGVAPNAQLLVVRALKDGGGFEGDVIAGINWCTDQRHEYNVTTISMSLGGETQYSDYCDAEVDSTLTAAINDATNAGIGVVVSSGNDGSSSGISSPACVQNAIAVTSSVKDDDELSSFSNRNSLVELTAPGGTFGGGVSCDPLSSLSSRICSTWNDQGYYAISGTSMAAPHVSASVAVMQQYLALTNRSRTPSQLETLFSDTGKAIADVDSGRDYFRINLFGALQALIDQEIVTSASYPAGWQNRPFNVTLNATTSGAGIAYTTYRLNQGDWINGTLVEINQSKNNTLEFYSTSIDGVNESVRSEQPLLDIIPPNTTALGVPSNWSNQSLNITLNASDNLSGVNYTSYRVDNGSWINDTNVWFNESGNFSLAFFSVDVAGNQEPITNQTVLVDLSAPNLAVVAPTGWQNESYFIVWSANDSFSGVKNVTYQFNNSGNWTQATNVSVEQEGNFSLHVQAVDHVNNTNLVTLRTLLDRAPPTTTLDVTSNWSNEVFNQSLNASDELSGVNYTSYRVDNGSWINDTNVWFNESGNFSLAFFSVDNAGNQEPVTNKTLLLDLTAPNVSVSAPRTWQNTSFNVTFNASDAHSGLQTATLQLNNQTPTTNQSVTIDEEGNHTVTVTAVDNANNTRVVAAQALLDTSAPTTQLVEQPTSWQSENFTAVFNATDTLSGVNFTEYYNGTNWTQASNVTFSDGNHTLLFRSTDNAGNREQASNVTILVDTQPPIISGFRINDSQPAANQSILFSANITDNTSIQSTLLVAGEEKNFNSQNPPVYEQVRQLPAATYQATISAVDEAGNEQTQQLTFTVYEKESFSNQTINDTEIDSRAATRTKLRLKTASVQQANLTVLASKDRPAAITKELKRAVRYSTIQLSSNVQQDLEWAILTISYEEDDISSLDEETLRISYYNESSEQWINLSQELSFVNEVGIDTSNQEVWANVSTFSTYAITGEEPEPEEDDTGSDDSSSGSTGSTGGGGGGGGAITTTASNESSRTLTFLRAGQPAIAIFNNNNLAIKRITFTPEQDTNSATLHLEKKPLPTDAPRQATQYLELSYPDALQVSDVKLRYESSLEEATLYRDTGSGWQALEQTTLEQGVFEATSPGLSRFAVAPADSLASQELVEEETKAIEETPTNQTTPQETSPAQELVQEQEFPEPTDNKWFVKNLLYVLLGLAVLSVPAVIIENPWKNKKH